MFVWLFPFCAQLFKGVCMSTHTIRPTSLATLSNLGLLSGIGSGTATVDEGFLRSLMAPMIEAVDFDERWYLGKYADVKDAVATGQVASAHAHYVRSGYFENRMPRRIAVDERWYVATYRDIGEALKKAHWKNAQEHFEDFGFREGRLPHPNFSL
jgi:hypothetical protein